MSPQTEQGKASGLPLSLDGAHGRITDAKGETFCDLNDIFFTDFNTDLLKRAQFIVTACNNFAAQNARLFQGECFARSFLKWAEQMRSVGRTLPGMEARESEARGFLTLADAESEARAVLAAIGGAEK